jgi:hypothetical protein
VTRIKLRNIHGEKKMLNLTNALSRCTVAAADFENMQAWSTGKALVRIAYHFRCDEIVNAWHRNKSG